MLESVRRAVGAAIAQNPAGLKGEAIAARLGVATSVLYRWGEHKDLPLWRLVQFTLATGALGPLAALARLCGCVIIPLPRETGEAAHAAALEAIRSFSAFMDEDARDLLNGVTPEELGELETKSQAAQVAITHVVEAARAKAQELPA